MEPRIISRPTFTVVGLLQDNEKIGASIDDLWENLGSRLSEIRGADPDVGFGVHFSQEDGHRYLVGFAVSEPDSVPVGMTAIDFDAHEYAVFTHQGTLEGINDTMVAFYSDWLPSSGYQQDDTYYFEVYDDRFIPNSPDSLIAIYVPIREIISDA